MTSSSKTLEQIWSELRTHIEWAQGFTLIVLFASHPEPVERLRRRLEESLHLRTRRLQVLRPGSPEEARTLADRILAARAPAGPLWVELWREAADPAWRDARAFLLHRLNERRFGLEQATRLPLVLVLPTAERSRLAVEAPDLWVIRSFTAELAGERTHPASRSSTRTSPGEEAFPSAPLGASVGAAELEWIRLWNQVSDRARLDARDGFAAIDSAIERGDFDAARAYAVQTLELARSQVDAGSVPEHARDLSVSLNNVGRVEGDLGNLEAARAAYRESLDLARQLHSALGDTPQALRDLSISLNNVGRVEGDLGNLEAARAAYRESLDLRRQLHSALGDTPEALRDLSISLNNVGRVEGDLGNLEAARAAYRESLDLRRQLHSALGDTPQALRDLSVSLDNVGGVEGDLGNLEAARAAYRESLDLARQLHSALGDTPQALRDLSVSLDNVGRVEGDLGNLEAARRAFQEGVEIARRLVQLNPMQPRFKSVLDRLEATLAELEQADPSPGPDGGGSQ